MAGADYENTTVLAARAGLGRGHRVTAREEQRFGSGDGAKMFRTYNTFHCGLDHAFRGASADNEG